MVENNYKHYFDIPDEVIYLNTSSNGPQLRSATEAVKECLKLKQHPWKRKEKDFYELAHKIRQLSADIFGGTIDNYAIHPSVSYGVATMLNIVGDQLSCGDEVLIMKDEYPNYELIWQGFTVERGIILKRVERETGERWVDAFKRQMNEKTKICLLSTCTWFNGELVEVDKLSKICRANDVIFSIDATQTLGAMPFDIDLIRPDFMFAAGYKWMLSAYGFSLFYISSKWLNSIHLESTITYKNSSFNNSKVSLLRGFHSKAMKFDVGQTCAHNILTTVVESLKQIKAWGVEHISNELKTTTTSLSELFCKNGLVKKPGVIEYAPHIFGVVSDVISIDEVYDKLQKKRVYTSCRMGYLRISPYLNVDNDNLQKLEKILSTIID